MQNRDAAVEVSAALKVVAVGLMKIANDLRLLTSGPRAGLERDRAAGDAARLEHHARQGEPGDPRGREPGGRSSDRARRDHRRRRLNGNLDLNVMMPVIAHALLESLDLMANAATSSRVAAWTASRPTRALPAYAERTAALVTAIAPVIGYDAAAKVFHRALAEDRPVRDVIVEEGLLSGEEVDRVLDLRKLARGGRIPTPDAGEGG